MEWQLRIANDDNKDNNDNDATRIVGRSAAS